MSATSDVAAQPTAPSDTASWNAEIRAGRFWHAVSAFQTAAATAPLAPGDHLDLARAEAGWSNWEGVIARLRDQDWLARYADGEGLFLLARAQEEGEHRDDAIAAYRAFLDVAGFGDTRIPVSRIRLARLLTEKEGVGVSVLEQLDALPAGEQDLRSWAALELARERVERGDAEGVAILLERIADREAANRKWDLLPRALLGNADSVAALRAYEEGLADLDRADARAASWARIGELRAALGDTAAARDAFLNTLELRSEGAEAVQAGVGLVKLGVTTDAFALQVGRTLASASRWEQARDAYERYRELAPAGSVGARERMEYGRVLARLRDRDEAVAELLPLVDDPSVGGDALAELIRIRKGQRRSADVRQLEDRIVERFPEHPTAVETVFLRADAAHDAGRISQAMALYRRTVEMAPTAERAELARMRLGQLHITRGELAQAAEVFEAHLTEVPTGEVVDEAAYWAAWTRLQLGDRGSAVRHVERVLELDPVSYYAVQTAHLMDMPYRIPLDERAPTMRPVWLTTGLERLDVFKAAGLDQAERIAVDLLVERASGVDDHLLHVAQGLHERDWNWRALDLGWQVRRRGRSWDRHLLEVLYPFPHETLVRREAAEWGVDPFLVAGLIRQESAFWAGARSSANARGLMQVLPETGSVLARRIGPASFQAASLYQPDVNVHLGTAYLRDMLRRYDDQLPLVLSAYNAGPTRANRWRRTFPEVSDPVRFTERIPFRETRGYVKNVTRNREIYAFLYGSRAE